MDSHHLGVPFALEDGWPAAVAGKPVIACESGIILGGVCLSDATLQGLKGTGLLSLRIDDHEELDGWTTTYPDGRIETRDFIIPTLPLEVPDGALSQCSFTDWVMANHGGRGRLLLWDSGASWWLLNEPDLELTLICSDRARFESEFDEWASMPFEWVNEDFWTEQGIRIVAYLSRKYSLDWPR
jgi:hypothetical protein